MVVLLVIADGVFRIAASRDWTGLARIGIVIVVYTRLGHKGEHKVEYKNTNANTQGATPSHRAEHQTKQKPEAVSCTCNGHTFRRHAVKRSAGNAPFFTEYYQNCKICAEENHHLQQTTSLSPQTKRSSSKANTRGAKQSSDTKDSKAVPMLFAAKMRDLGLPPQDRTWIQWETPANPAQKTKIKRSPFEIEESVYGETGVDPSNESSSHEGGSVIESGLLFSMEMKLKRLRSQNPDLDKKLHFMELDATRKRYNRLNSKEKWIANWDTRAVRCGC